MKRIILLVLILVVTPFLVESEKTLHQQVEEIRIFNSKNPETANWEYVKDKAFSNNHVIQKAYDKPVIISLDKSATYNDSIIVGDFIDELKTLLPNIKIGFELPTEILFPYHYIKLSFRKDSIEYDRFSTKERYLDGNIVGRTRPGFKTSSDGSKHSFLNFEFHKETTDEKRRVSIQQELLKTVFLTEYMKDSYNNLFPIQPFNDIDNLKYGFLGKFDKFLLQKLYSDDFLTQFENYLYAHYPWRYAYSFLHKKKMELLAVGVVSLLGIIVFLLLFSLFQSKKFKNPFLNYYIPVVLIWAHLANLHSIYTYFTRFNSIHSWGSFVLFMLIAVPLFALITTFIMWGLDKVFIREQTRFSSQLALKVVFTLIAFLTPQILVFFFDNHENEGIDFFLPDFFLFVALAIGRGIFFYLNQMSDSLVKQKDVELSNLKEINAQAELKLLQSHINPHFLYNALNSIAGLAHDDADKTEKMALSLSDLFRYSINKKGKKMSTVSEEVTLVENYLEIEKIRFGERLVFTLTIDEDAKEEKIPMFMLQPLIENAIKHGVSKIGGDAKISLDIKKEDKGLLITVGDNGPAFPQGLVSGHGLQTVYDLLRLSYGDKASLSWENTPKKQIVISINNR